MEIQKYFKLILLSLIAMLILVIIGSDGKDFFYLSIIIFYFLFLRGNKWIDFINIILFILIIELLFTLNGNLIIKNYLLEGLFIFMLLLIPSLHISYIIGKDFKQITKQKYINITNTIFVKYFVLSIVYFVLFIMLAVVIKIITKEQVINSGFEIEIIKNDEKIYFYKNNGIKRDKCIELKAYKYTTYLHPDYKIYFPFERRYISEEKKFLGSIKKCIE